MAKNKITERQYVGHSVSGLGLETGDMISSWLHCVPDILYVKVNWIIEFQEGPTKITNQAK